MSIDEIFPILQKLVAEQFAKDLDDITLDTAFDGDLNALKTVGDAVNYIADRLNK